MSFYSCPNEYGYHVGWVAYQTRTNVVEYYDPNLFCVENYRAKDTELVADRGMYFLTYIDVVDYKYLTEVVVFVVEHCCELNVGSILF